MKKLDLFPVYVVILFWSLLSFMASVQKVISKSCGADYQIDYILATNLFCKVSP